ncbi:hypothetical protein [Lampropedia aestuarii]|nr:hypothetical protein [Lampropedia aestuarii]MDH5857819.1 hypothetical protein [Lampropedia aestuarii]
MKRIAAIEAFVVVEIGFVDLLADTATDFVTNAAADNATDDGAE